VEFTTRFVQLEGAPHYRGHDGVRDWWRDVLAIFPDFALRSWRHVTWASS
jgi:hypothetical protein